MLVICLATVPLVRTGRRRVKLVRRLVVGGLFGEEERQEEGVDHSAS